MQGAYFHLGNIYYNDKEYNKALDNYTKLANMMPEKSFIHVDTAKALLGMNDIDSAIEELTIAIKICRFNTSAYLMRGKLYCKKKLFFKGYKDFIMVFISNFINKIYFAVTHTYLY